MSSTIFSGTNDGLQIGHNQGPIEAKFCAYNAEDIDRFCLRELRCPDSLVVKNRLKETKDKLLPKSLEWIFQDPQYASWRSSDRVCLLWIKGGAGKGKTMMSIGLIEELTRARHESTVVSYFFCQNADNELNTLQAIIKGLLLQLVNQRIELKDSLRCRWDTVHNRFNEDVNSWRNLWNILMEMLDRCQCSKVYIIVDALDECQDNGLADFFKCIVRNGLDHPAKIKWLITSRPLDSAERALLAGLDQVQVSLELNSEYISETVEAYITHKVNELGKFQRYDETLRTKVKMELTAKAEGTFLWVSLVCKKLESVYRDDALATIRNLPPGLHPFYDRILNQLSKGEADDVQKCMRLLKVMMLAYRPLKVEEIPSLTGLTDENAIETLVNRCASLIRMQANNIEFVHQSARDYLAGKNGQSILDSCEHFGHDNILLCCLSYLSKSLKVNLLGLSQPDSTRESLRTPKHKRENDFLAGVDYAATFWVRHLQNTKRARSGITEKGVVANFLYTKLLEWLECLSLLNQLPRAIEGLKTLANIAKNHVKALALVQDATRFLLRHYHTLANWPLQIYSSAIIFSPESSFVKRRNRDKIPAWFRKFPVTEDTWTSLLQTLAGHSDWVTTIAFSPNGKLIASGSKDKSIRLWDAVTGELQKTILGHSGSVNTLTFSLDGTQIASGSDDRDVKLWSTARGVLQKTLVGHSNWITTMEFSPDGKLVASGSADRTIKVWDAVSGKPKQTLVGHSDWITTIKFSPDGELIASGSDDNTIKLWGTATGSLRKTLAGHLGPVNSVAFSPDSRQIASTSDDSTIKLWDTMIEEVQKKAPGHSGRVNTVAISPDGKLIASGSDDDTIQLWDTTTGDLWKKLSGHQGKVNTVAFSPDSKLFASSSADRTIKLWDTASGEHKKTLSRLLDWVATIVFSPDGKQIVIGSDDGTVSFWDAATGNPLNVTTGRFLKGLSFHWSRVNSVAFSPDGKLLASGSNDQDIKLWDTATGALQKTLRGHSGRVTIVAFSSDGKKVASGSNDNTIKLWDVANSLDASKYFGSTLSSLWKFRSWQEISTSEQVYTLKFSADDRYLATNIGPICLECAPTDRKDVGLDILQNLYIKDRWICYGDMPFFRLPSDFQPACDDVRGNQVTIGFQNGQVLSFDIDRSILHSMLRQRRGMTT